MADVIEKKEGRDKEARRWPVKQLAEEAHEHIALFDHETRQQIQEYCELVAVSPTMTTPRSGCRAHLQELHQAALTLHLLGALGLHPVGELGHALALVRALVTKMSSAGFRRRACSFRRSMSKSSFKGR